MMTENVNRDRSSGFFITFEGIDGCGKSTQARLLSENIAACALGDVLHTFEPGGWKGGIELRNLLLSGNISDFQTELLLFLADRSGHVDSVINPALEDGKIVICERYSDSTMAYQVWGRGGSLSFTERLIADCGFPVPDITIFLDLSVQEAERRLFNRGKKDVFEKCGIAFMERVSEGYRELARREPQRIVAVDAAKSEGEVAYALAKALRDRFSIFKNLR